MAMRDWLVAGALIESGESAGDILLVCNRRRGGGQDWSTPGGVIDDADVNVLAGLSREVVEETGLRVSRWEGPLYEVVVEAPDLGWRMRCEVHRALAWIGPLCLEDPDGIVFDAAFVAPPAIPSLLDGCARWVSEPLSEWLADRWSASDARAFRYDVRGATRDALEVDRAPAHH